MNRMYRSFWKRVAKVVNACASMRKAINRCYYTHVTRMSSVRCGKDLRVHYRSDMERCEFGDNCNFNGMTVQGSHVVFGNNFHSGRECLIITRNHNYDEGTAIPYDSTYIRKSVVIEDNVWFGDRVTVVGNVRIGEGAILGAGAVVVKDVPKCAIVGGNPARVLKFRDMQHYEELKKAGKFH